MPKIDTPIIANYEGLGRILKLPLPSLWVIYENKLPDSLDKTLKTLAKQKADALLTVKLDATNQAQIKQEYSFKGGQLLLAFKDGQEIGRNFAPQPQVLEDYAAYLLGQGPQPQASTPPLTTAPAKPIHISDAEFTSRVLNSPTLVLVDFWAEWCGPCRTIAPLLDKVAKELAGQVTIAKLNVDHNPQTPQHYGIRGIPTLLLFKQGQLVDKLVGAAPEPMLRQFLQKHL